MTHADLVLAAVRWLRREQRCTVILAEFVSSHSAETPDAIGWRVDGRGNTRSHVVECKVSIADLRRDASKPSRRSGATLLGNQRWYLVPIEIAVPALRDSLGMALQSPGLLAHDGKSIRIVKQAREREHDAAITRAESPLLVSAIRRLMNGDRHDAKTGRFESMRNANRRRLHETQAAYDEAGGGA